jgi:16S rRNA (guanine527-N7)-methyltransferase
LAVLPYLWAGKWLDVGCGGGLPGLVLAIARPSWEFTLIDSNSKKTSFVMQAIIELGLKNVKVNCVRVEAFTSNVKFDGIISRAFAETAEFVKRTQHLLAENGHWAAMKGAPEQELQRLPSEVMVQQIIPLKVSGLDASRCLVILKAK